MNNKKKIVAKIKKAFKKVAGTDNFLLILACYNKDPGMFPEEAAKVLKEIKEDLYQELFEDYYKNRKVA